MIPSRAFGGVVIALSCMVLGLAGCSRTPRIEEKVPGLERAHVRSEDLLPAHPLWTELQAVEEELARRTEAPEGEAPLPHLEEEAAYYPPEEKIVQANEIRVQAEGAAGNSATALAPYAQAKTARSLDAAQEQFRDELAKLGQEVSTGTEEAERRVTQGRLEAARRTAIPRAEVELPARIAGRSEESYRPEIERLHRAVEAETRSLSQEEAARLRTQWNRQTQQAQEAHQSKVAGIESAGREARAGMETQAAAERGRAGEFFETTPAISVPPPQVRLEKGQETRERLGASLEAVRSAQQTGRDERRAQLLQRREQLRRQMLQDIQKAAPLVARAHHLDLVLDRPAGRDVTDSVREWLRAYYRSGERSP